MSKWAIKPLLDAICECNESMIFILPMICDLVIKKYPSLITRNLLRSHEPASHHHIVSKLFILFKELVLSIQSYKLLQPSLPLKQELCPKLHKNRLVMGLLWLELSGLQSTNFHVLQEQSAKLILLLSAKLIYAICDFP